MASACFAQTQPFWVNYPKQTAQQSSSSTSFHSRDTEMQGCQRAHPKPTSSMMNPSKGWSRRVRGLLCSHMEPISHCGRHPRCSRNILPRSTAHPLPRRGAPELNVTLRHRQGRRSSPFCCPFCHRAAGTPELLAASAVIILLSCHCHVTSRHSRLPSPVALLPSCLLCAAPCKVARKSLIGNFLLPFFPHPGKKNR